MTTKRNNNPEFLREFINIYRSHPSLWKIKDKIYVNRALRRKGYSALIKHYQTIEPWASQDTVRNKINNIKSAFRKELKKVNKSKKSGSPDEVYVPSLWYYNLLLFTADHGGRQVGETSNDSGDEDGNVNEEATSCKMEEEVSMSPVPDKHTSDAHHDESNTSIPPVASKTTSSLVTISRRDVGNNNLRIDDVPEVTYKNLAQEVDEFDAIGKTLTYKLRRMNENQRNIAEYLMNQVAFFGVQNKLEETTQIYFPPKS